MSNGTMCHDCGSSTHHWLSPGWCRPCAEKAGHGYMFRKTIDLEVFFNELEKLGMGGHFQTLQIERALDVAESWA